MSGFYAAVCECVTVTRIVRIHMERMPELDAYYEGNEWLRRVLIELEAALDRGADRAQVVRMMRSLTSEIDDEQTPIERPTRPPGEF